MKRGHEGNGDERDNKRVCSSQEGEYNYSLENLPVELVQTILETFSQDILPQNHPAFPASCLKAFRNIIGFMKTNKTCYNKALKHIENAVINPLIRFNNQNIGLNPKNGRDLVASCFAFKILTGIRRCSISSSFCDAQYERVCDFLITHRIITQQEIQQGHWNPCEDGALLKAVEDRNIINVVKAIAAGANACEPINLPQAPDHSTTALQRAAFCMKTNIIRALVNAVPRKQRVAFTCTEAYMNNSIHKYIQNLTNNREIVDMFTAYSNPNSGSRGSSYGSIIDFTPRLDTLTVISPIPENQRIAFVDVITRMTPFKKHIILTTNFAV